MTTSREGMRPARDTDFFVELPDVGRFRYGRMTFGDRIRVRAEYLRLTQGMGGEDVDLDAMAAIAARHKVLCVAAPAGWHDLEAVDTLVDETLLDQQVLSLDEKRRAAEDSFRRGGATAGQAGGADAGADAGVLGAAPVQPVAP